ncbi:MAG: short-subunit dehydrogenase [Candidatus Woesearchaeota archaeon]|jgi:short-subunit dehydrogenase
MKVLIGATSDIGKEVIADIKVTRKDLDVTNQQAIQTFCKKNTQIDTLIYCVSAPTLPKRIEQLSWEDFETHINVQLKGLFSFVQTLVQQGNKTFTLIPIFTEYVVSNPPSRVGAYVSAKYAALGFCKAVQTEFPQIKIHAVSPAMTQTKLLNNLPPKAIELQAERTGILTPKQVANVINTVGSKEESYSHTLICANGDLKQISL